MILKVLFSLSPCGIDLSEGYSSGLPGGLGNRPALQMLRPTIVASSMVTGDKGIELMAALPLLARNDTPGFSLPAPGRQELFGRNIADFQTRHGVAQILGCLGNNLRVLVMSGGLNDGLSHDLGF
jgi:hypothetical protein